MRKFLATLGVAATCALGTALLSAQAEPPATNPLAGNDAAIQAGMGIFRSRCGLPWHGRAGCAGP